MPSFTGAPQKKVGLTAGSLQHYAQIILFPIYSQEKSLMKHQLNFLEESPKNMHAGRPRPGSGRPRLQPSLGHSSLGNFEMLPHTQPHLPRRVVLKIKQARGMLLSRFQFFFQSIRVQRRLICLKDTAEGRVLGS